MYQRDKVFILLLFCWILPTSNTFLLPLLFPLSIKITIHSKPTPPPPVKSYHFETVPVYKEVSIKGSTHISAPHYGYGDGVNYGTTYNNGYPKVYKGVPTIDGHISITSNPAPPPKSAHITITSGTTYDDSHYKGLPYPHTHYKGSSYEAPQTHYKGTDDSTHYKGTAYVDVPKTHYKDTEDGTHYKGTPYDEGHIKGSPYDDDQHTVHQKGTPYQGGLQIYEPASKPKHVYKEHNYIKQVGGYKLTDYIKSGKVPNYDDEDGTGYIVIPPGKTFAEMEAAHKAANAHKLSGSPKAYAAEEYADLGSPKDYGHKYGKDYEHDPTYIDDTIPAYKANIPRPRYGSRKIPDYRYEASSSRYDRVVPKPKEKRIYAGFGTSVYGDSYAKIVYVPKSLKVSVRRYTHK